MVLIHYQYYQYVVSPMVDNNPILLDAMQTQQ